MKKNTFVFIALLCLLVFAQQKGSMSPQESLPVTGTFTDPRDGQTYRTVKIGKQTWMAENLNYQTDNSWCYDNADSNCVKYGRLYTWDAARKACPVGWRMPTEEDWEDFDEEPYEDKGEFGMKFKSKTGWDDCRWFNCQDGGNKGDEPNCPYEENGNGTDDFGFSALPGGIRENDGEFFAVGRTGSWWLFFTYGLSNRSMKCNNNRVFYMSGYSKNHGLSVRCVRDVVRQKMGAVPQAEAIVQTDATVSVASMISVDSTTVMFTDDRDGKTYRIVKIGKLMWMAENLNYQTKDSWCYDNADSNCVKYGRLYTLDAAEMACPVGWRMPTEEDWEEFDEESNEDKGEFGMKLKSKTGWDDCRWFNCQDGGNKGDEYNCPYEENGNGTDDFGFSALPGGIRENNGEFVAVGRIGSWWNFFTHVLSNQSMSCDRNRVFYMYGYSKNHGLSVRCVRDVDQ